MIDIAGTAYVVPTGRAIGKWWKKLDIEIEMGPQAGGSRAITEVKSNNLLLAGFSAAGNVASKILADVRIRYTDSWAQQIQ